MAPWPVITPARGHADHLLAVYERHDLADVVVPEQVARPDDAVDVVLLRVGNVEIPHRSRDHVDVSGLKMRYQRLDRAPGLDVLPGPLASGHSSTVLLHAAPSDSKKRKKKKG